jgi:polyhydroxyalkanoate synthase
MTMPDPQAMATAWMTQFANPTAWQSWPSMLPATVPAAPNMAEANPLSAILKDAGASLKPGALEALRNDYIDKAAALWQDFIRLNTPPLKDRRFAAPEWSANPLSHFSAASYLLNAEFLTALADAVDAPPRELQKIKFAVQQMVDAMSPANFLATNPEAQQQLIETKGESLAKGLSNMLTDMQKGRISLSDESAFEVGRNVATAPGEVIFENHLFQLIQYTPSTPTVHAVPLMMVPPCINKYYILDLQPENSLVRYAVEQGNNVFLVSWRNPDEELANTTWDDYVEHGVIKAIEVVRDVSGSEKVNAFGFCVGGTIVSSALAVLAARGEQPAASLTLLTTLLDYSDTGVLDVFIDESQVSQREKALAAGGLMPGRDLASTFSSLRPNDLVWNYVQSNYLKGKQPVPFDLLYWNSDSTNLPGPMFCFYLRNMYLENNLREPGKVTVAGVPVNLGDIAAPTFIYGSKEDHIVPWSSAYESMRLLNPGKSGANRFVLGASGHIAGVINPASKKKRSYWSHDGVAAAGDAASGADGASDGASSGAKAGAKNGASKAAKANGKNATAASAAANAATNGAANSPVPAASDWFNSATEHAGSWWPEWARFLADNGGPDVKAPGKPGNARYKPVEPAPGRYVKVRAD